jgi:hypothetical protein
MVDIQTVSIAIASASVVAGVVYYALQLRHQNRMRQTDLVVRLYSAFNSDDFLEALLKIRNLEVEDYRDFVKKYGSVSLETPVNVAIFRIANYYEEVGTLLHRGLIDAELVSEFLLPSTIVFWNKLKPIIEGFREELGSRFYYYWFECLYNEMKKREQKLQSKA